MFLWTSVEDGSRIAPRQGPSVTRLCGVESTDERVTITRRRERSPSSLPARQRKRSCRGRTPWHCICRSPSAETPSVTTPLWLPRASVRICDTPRNNSGSNKSRRERSCCRARSSSERVASWSAGPQHGRGQSFFAVSPASQIDSPSKSFPA